MQMKIKSRIVCVILTILMVLPLLLSIPFTASAATNGYRVVAMSSGSIGYVGKNYATGATNSSQTFELNSGFLVEKGSDTYWATCGYSGAKDPPVGTEYSTLQAMAASITDGLNNWGGGTHGSHYVVGAQNGNDSSWGYGMSNSTNFIFRCFYYANLHMQDEFGALSAANCTLQEAIAIAFRYEWDTRLIKYGNTGTWNNARKVWTVNSVSSWRTDTTHFNRVSDGNSTHKAIVDAANAILVYAMQDPDGISGKIKTSSDGNTLSYVTSDGQTCTLQYASGVPREDNPKKNYQALLLYSPFAIPTNEFYDIQVKKVDENGKALPGVTFYLFRETSPDEYTFYKSQETKSNGLAVWRELDAGKYYVQEVSAPTGYAVDDTKHYFTLGDGGDSSVTIELTNYKATGSWTPKGTKLYKGHDLSKEKFNFELREGSSTGRVLQTVQNNGSNITFNAIKYTASDIGKQFTYVMLESTESVPGEMVADSHTVTFTVTVNRGTGNNLDIRVATAGNTTFENKDWNDAFGAIGIKKVDENGNPLAGAKFNVYHYRHFWNSDGSWLIYGDTFNLSRWLAFKLQLKDKLAEYGFADSSFNSGYDAITGAYKSVTNGDDGLWVLVDTITTGPNGEAVYGKDGDTYKIWLPGSNETGGQIWNLSYRNYAFQEIKAPAGYLIDDTIYECNIAPNRDQPNVGQITWANGGDAVVNVPNTVTWTPMVGKKLTGEKLKEGMFYFQFEDQVVANDENGKAFFAPVTYLPGDVGKSYIYHISEVGADPDLVDFDYVQSTASKGGLYIRVTVHMRSDGTLYLSWNLNFGSPTFSSSSEITSEEELNKQLLNAYVFENIASTSYSASYTPEVKKVYNKTLYGGDFVFVLEEDGVEIQRVTNGADGSVVFDPIEYAGSVSSPKRTYTIREIVGDDPTIKYSTNVYTFTLQFVLSGGQMTAVMTPVSGSSTFENYSLRASWVPNVRKVLEGGTLEDEQFEFELLKDGVVIQTASNNAEGQVSFEEIQFTLDDDGKTYTYTVREVKGSVPYIGYDDHVVTYTVKVTSTGTELNVEATVSGFTVFSNRVNGAIGVKKVNDKGEPLSGVTFAIYLDNGGADFVGDMTTDSDGLATYGLGTNEKLTAGMTYYVQESSVPDGYIRDYTFYPVFVVARQTTYINNGNPVVNEPLTGKWIPTVMKVLEGGNIFPDYAKSFTFVLEENGVELQRVSQLILGGSPNTAFIDFAPVVYTMADVGTHTYTIREVKGSEILSYDEHVITYEVSVSYSRGAIIATQTSVEGATVFTNEIPTGSWVPKVNKVLEGRPLTNGEFTFVLENQNGDVLQRKPNNAVGAIPFTALSYGPEDVDKEYTYTVREVVGDDDSIIYDEHVITYKVKISYSGTGKDLTIEETVEGDTTFTNELKIRPGRIAILKTDPYGTVLAGAEFLLEWSEDGETWFPVAASTEPVKGGCTSEGLADGKLITDEEGRAVFDGLDSSLRYRLTETKAPEGMQLLADYAYEGMLDDHEDLTVSLHVVNVPQFKIPDTGDHGFGYLLFVIPMVCCLAAAVVLAAIDKRKKV